jgi:predicted RNase H-like nuclease
MAHVSTASAPMNNVIIGVDCATDVRKIGIARGIRSPEELRVDAAAPCSSEATAADTICDLIGPRRPALIAFDAPLGWPIALGASLATHRAGGRLPQQANGLFRRHTDDFIATRIGKRPLDVGADRIARTAHSALQVLHDLRNRLAVPVPLAWAPSNIQDVAAIEVYPAATLKQLGLPYVAYKKNEQQPARTIIVDGLSRFANVEGIACAAALNADVLDAVVCVIAGNDFLAGRCHFPENQSAALHEGWIWVRAS